MKNLITISAIMLGANAIKFLEFDIEESLNHLEHQAIFK